MKRGHRYRGLNYTVTCWGGAEVKAREGEGGGLSGAGGMVRGLESGGKGRQGRGGRSIRRHTGELTPS